MQRRYYLLGWGYMAMCMMIVLAAKPTRQIAPPRRPVTQATQAVVMTPATDAAQWFRRVKPYCNSVEVSVLQRQEAAPATVEGAGYHAACFALAGRIDDARRIIDQLAGNDRLRAVSIVFDVGHPVADAGDDRSAGPIMELVIDYLPNHYMALYHAGMAEYMLGQRALATRNLEAFLEIYHENDGWRSNGIDVLNRLRDSTSAQQDVRRPREP